MPKDILWCILAKLKDPEILMWHSQEPRIKKDSYSLIYQPIIQFCLISACFLLQCINLLTLSVDDFKEVSQGNHNKKDHHTQEAHQECETAESSITTKISDTGHLILLI